MKKANFVVVFWLTISLISFIVFLMSFGSLWNDISYIIIPSSEYMSASDTFRSLIQTVPMLIFCMITFAVGFKQGMEHYNKHIEEVAEVDKSKGKDSGKKKKKVRK